MASLPAAPITRQIAGSRSGAGAGPSGGEPGELRDAARRVVVDGDGQRIPFGALFREHRAIVVFVRDAEVRLIVIGQSSYHHIKPFCSLTGYHHEIYVDPEREIYKILGMKRGEAATSASVISHSLKTGCRAIRTTDLTYAQPACKIKHAVRKYQKHMESNDWPSF